VVPPQGAKPAAFLDQNEDASRYLLRKLPAVDLAPLVLTSPQPIYPPIARAAHISGSVAIRLVVSDKGTVISASSISGPEMLRVSASDAAKHWTFHALQVGATPAPFTVDLNANFTMAADPRKCTKDDPCWMSTIPEGKVTMNP
jgi:TonB family protein